MTSKFIIPKAKAFVPHHISNHTVLSFLKLLSWRVPGKKISENITQNLRVLSEAVSDRQSFFQRNTYIENQCQWDKVRFGSYTMDYSGCEIIATYNALLALGKPMTEREMTALISRFEAKGAVLSGGFGVHPEAIVTYFRELGYHVQMTTDTAPDILQELGRQSDTVILTVYNDRDDLTAQIHTVNVTKDEHGRFFLHNGYKRRREGGNFRYVASGPYGSLQGVVRDVAGGNAGVVSAIGLKTDWLIFGSRV